ncbi:MAG: Peroxisome chaperone and import receptor [Geoglossum simile]|nr:MAG: Peroxisome chaperone and import receptor [Geoglossum simile]
MEKNDETPPDDPREAKSAPPSEPLENSSDLEEDDLDDLDGGAQGSDYNGIADWQYLDMLGEFSTTKINDQERYSPPPGPGRPIEPLFTNANDDFAKELQAEMAELLGESETPPDMQQQLKKLVRELGDAAALASDEGIEPARSGPSTAADDTFQRTIRRTMQRMQESGEQATAAVATDGTDDILAEMLKQMQGGALEGSEEDFSNMLLGMMEQLTNKDILYEPMRELNEKFPAWLEKNKDNIPKEDLERYRGQRVLVGEIVAKFEEKGFADSNATDREYIVERMQKMQAAGSPPPDLVGDLNPTQEALGDLDAGCPQQ